jgi:hypothetical protein
VSATCKSCGTSFAPKRPWQEYCKPICKDRSAKQRLRAEKRVDMANPLSVPAECVDSRPVPPRGRSGAAPEPGLRQYVWPTPPRGLEDVPRGPTPGALQGDEYIIEMDADGYPILPACLARRRGVRYG